MTVNITETAAAGISIEQAVGLAHAHWDAGQADQAERLCQQVLAAWPGHSDAHHLLGLMAHAYGNPDVAIDRLRKACQSPRTPPLYFSNLAEMCRRKGLLAEAEQAGRTAVGIDQSLSAGWNNLGIVLQEAGKLDESNACLERVVTLKPTDPEGYNNLGNTMKRLGRLDAAREYYETAIKLHPNYAEAHSNLSNLLNDLGCCDDALAAARRAIDANPRLADAYVNAAAAELSRNCYLEALRWIDMLLAFAPIHSGGLTVRALTLRYLDRLPDALTAAERAVSIGQANGEALNVLGEVLQASGRTDEALNAYDRAIEGGGFVVEKAMVNRGVALMERGDNRGARVALDDAVARFPRSASAWQARADIKHFQLEDPEPAAMAALLGPGGIESGTDRLVLHFSLGKALMDCGEAEQAFVHLNAGNRLKRAGFDYDADATDLWLRSIAAKVTAGEIARLQGAGAASELPVFVFGMPRSGTTLIEQILASHSLVQGAGELSCLYRLIAQLGPYPAALAQMTTEVAQRVGRAYLDLIEPLSQDKRRLIDKMPSNFLYAGLIPLLLPQARMIHVRRNPLDTCLSCYSRLFAKEQQFSYDLMELGRFYLGYERLMDHWRSVLPPERFMEIRYEDVVADFETQARRLVAFIDLPWEASCLRFHETSRLVRTASLNQVRMPLFSTGVDRWKPYARQLEPLMKALGMAVP
jgi:tetratricopeptide (TPR) repeat protein